jgi:hypothetical protein
MSAAVRRLAAALAAAAVAVLALAGQAAARGGDYVLDGGTTKERAQVVAALEASSFDWSVVPARIAIHIVHGHDSEATPGEIWIDADLLDAGKFSWGLVQHEYAHQVDYFVLTLADRALLASVLGASDWCYGRLGLPHGDYGCERFASTLAWAYWPSPKNALRPTGPGAEAGAMAPAAFRALLGRLIAADRD